MMLLLSFFSPFCSLTASGPHPLLLYGKEFRYSVHFVFQRRNYIRFITTLGWVNCETNWICKANYSFKSVYKPNVSLFIKRIVIRHLYYVLSSSLWPQWLFYYWNWPLCKKSLEFVALVNTAGDDEKVWTCSDVCAVSTSIVAPTVLLIQPWLTDFSV